MPDFDTYHIVEKFARDSEDVANVLAFYSLFRHTKARIQGAIVAATINPEEPDYERAMHLLVTGSLPKDKAQVKGKLAKDMTPEELKAYFIGGLKANGIEVDPQLFTGN